MEAMIIAGFVCIVIIAVNSFLNDKNDDSQ